MIKWTQEEDDILIRSRQSGAAYKDIVLPNRTAKAVTARIGVLVDEGYLSNSQSKFKKWTEEEEIRLIELKKTHTLAQCAEILERTLESVRTRSKRLKKDYGDLNWTPNEIELLNSTMTYDQLVIILNRSKKSIESKAQKLGISRNRKYEFSDNELLDSVRKYKSKNIINYKRLSNEPSAIVIERRFGSCCGLGCGGCRPYLQAMLDTGATCFAVRTDDHPPKPCKPEPWDIQ